MKSEATKEYDKLYRRAVVKRRKDAGKCIECEEPAIIANRCLMHRNKINAINRKYGKKRAKIREEKGLCIRCGAPLEEDMDANHKKCLNCREYRNLPCIVKHQRRFNEDFQSKNARNL